MPDVVAKALQLIDDPSSGPGDFEDLLSRDPPLVATMLRLANSPIYGFAHKRETVREAIIGLGLNGLRGILLGSTLKRFLGKRFSCYGSDPKVLWRHAIAVATGARLLSKSLPPGHDHPDEIFVAGLLHDLGKLILAPFLTSSGVEITKTGETMHDLEERVLGVDHMEAGGILAEAWKLKPMVRTIISSHHHRTCPETHRHAMAIVRLVDRCATENGYSAGTVMCNPELVAKDLAVIGLTPEAWKESVETIVLAMETGVADI